MRTVLIAVFQLLAIVVCTFVVVEFEQGVTSAAESPSHSITVVGNRGPFKTAIKPVLPSDEQSLLAPSPFSSSCAKVRRLTTESLVFLGCFSFQRTVPQTDSTFTVVRQFTQGPSRQVLFSIWQF